VLQLAVGLKQDIKLLIEEALLPDQPKLSQSHFSDMGNRRRLDLIGPAVDFLLYLEPDSEDKMLLVAEMVVQISAADTSLLSNAVCRNAGSPCRVELLYGGSNDFVLRFTSAHSCRSLTDSVLSMAALNNGNQTACLPRSLSH